jgi:hypothetical protein
LVKNNLGVLFVLDGRLVEARDLFQSSLAILQKSHTASHPLLVSVRANLEQVQASIQEDRVIDVRQLKRYFHGQHFYYSPFGDTKREEKMQKGTAHGSIVELAAGDDWTGLTFVYPVSRS